MWQCLDAVDEEGGSGAFEDLAGGSGNLAWVLDGASAVSAERITDGVSDARWMVERLSGELEKLAGHPAALKHVVALAIERTAAVASKEWHSWPTVPPSAALGVVRRRGDATEFFVLADVSVIVRTDVGVFDFTDSRVDRGNSHAREAMDKMLRDGMTYAEAYAEVKPFLADYRLSRMNRPGGYWVASTNRDAVAHALTGSLDGVTDVVLATDGFMRAVDPFGLVAGVDRLFDPGCDLTGLADQIRRAEEDDPETRKYPRWRVSDDICARRLRWVD